MGWNPFKSKKKTSVDTAVMRVIEDDDLPETLKQSVLRAILQDTNVSEEILSGMIEGSVPKFDRMFAYAKEHYPLGLPDATMLASTNGQAVVKAVIDAEQRKKTTFDYFYFGPLSVSHYAREQLVTLYDYDAATNELTKLSKQRGYPVYVSDITALYTQTTVDAADPGTLESWGPPASGGVSPSRPLNNIVGAFNLQTPYEVLPGRIRDGIRVEYEWETPDGIKGASLTFNLDESVVESSFFQVQYHWTAGGKKHYRYWTYRQGSRKYPSIEQIHDPRYTGQGNYFPFIFFRSEKKDLTAKDQETTERYKTTSKMMDILGMDYKSLGEEIHKNPDIKDIEQAVMWLGVPLTSQDQEACAYLFQYFRRIFFLQTGGTGDQAIHISDADFAVNISYEALRYRRYPGKVTAPGKYVRAEKITTREEATIIWTGSLREGTRQGTPGTRTVRIRTLVWQYQESDGHYAEVELDTPSLRYEIWEGYSVTAAWDDERFLVPIDKSITDSFSMTDRERLYGKALHFIFNSRVTQKVKWYQTGFFRAIMVIAAIIITIYSLGNTWQAVVAAFAAGGVTAAAMVVITVILKAYVIQEGFKLFVKEVGAEAAFYAALIAAIYSMGSGFKAGSLKGAPWAEEMLSAASNIGNAIQSVQADLMAGLENDYLKTLELQENQLGELEKASNLLDVDGLINPLEFTRQAPSIILGESPSDFYTRTVHSGNVGALANEASLNFAEYALKLPEPHDTLGGFI